MNLIKFSKNHEIDNHIIYTISAKDLNGMPVAIIEAMKAGVAVAGAASGGIPEMVIDGHAGILFDPLKPAQISKAVNKLIRDKELRNKMAGRARKLLSEKLQSAAFKRKILKVYSNFSQPDE